MLSPEAVSTDTQYFGPGTRLSVLGEPESCCGTGGDTRRVFARGWGAVTQTQYFGPGTRLLVLGECGRRASIFVGLPGAVLCRRHPDLRGRQPADGGG